MATVAMGELLSLILKGFQWIRERFRRIDSEPHYRDKYSVYQLKLII